MDPGQPKEEPTDWVKDGGVYVDVVILGAVVTQDMKVTFIVSRLNHGSETRMASFEEIPTATATDWVCSMLGVASLPAVVSRTDIAARAGPSHQGTGGGGDPSVAAVREDEIEVLFEGPSVARQKAQKEKEEEKRRAEAEAYGKRSALRYCQSKDLPDSWS